MQNQISVVGVDNASHNLDDFKSMVGDTKNFIVFYHGRCNDGTIASYAADRGLQKQFGTDAQIFTKAVSYGKDFTIEETLAPFKELIDSGEGVAFLIVDFCFKDHEIEALSRISQAVLTLDHHKTAIDDMLKSDIVFDQSVLTVFADDNCMSGAGLAYRFFHPEESVPYLIQCVENHDLWHNNIPYVEEANLFVRNSHNKGFAIFDDACSSFEAFEKAVIPYASAVEYRKEVCKSLAASAHYTAISLPFFEAEEGQEEYPDQVHYNVAVVNCHPQFASDVGALLYEKPLDSNGTLPPFALMYHIEHDDEGNTNVKLSLRSQKGVGADVSAIAKHLGGGGHINAAGALIAVEDLFDLIGAYVEEENDDDDGAMEDYPDASIFMSPEFLWAIILGLVLFIGTSN